MQDNLSFTRGGFCYILVKTVVYGHFTRKRMSREDMYYMNGDINRICMNNQGHPAYGFISGEDGRQYFFYKTALTNCPITNLQEGDPVEFTPVPSRREPGKMNAVNVRKRTTSAPAEIQYVKPGMHQSVELDNFNQDERAIIQSLAQALYVTNGSKKKGLTLGKNCYHYVLVKPTEDYVVNFNLQREIPVIFSDYEGFEPRDLDVVACVAKEIPSASALRLDRSCQILVSRNSNVEEELGGLLRDNNLTSVVIPFSYQEFVFGEMTPDHILNRFRKYLFDADLFTASQPIENDVFFFGRRDYALDIATKCKRSSYLCGVFGLRRSGKTSMLYAIRRQLENAGCPVVFIACQVKLETLDWKKALFQVSEGVCDALKPDVRLCSKEKYEEDSANAFTEDMDAMLQGRSTPVVLMFDEIEAITFDVGKEGGPWHDGDSFIHFWNVLRGYCTKPDSNLSIVVAGTNPMINEVAAIGKDRNPNPMFQQLSASNQGSYLKPFDISSTKIMIDTLGGYMGIKFDETIPGRLVEDCGGHPYLIRLLCGQIYKYVREKKYQRPFQVSKAVYEAARAEFEKSNEAESFYLMILAILQTSYPQEYETLRILATDGDGQLSRVMNNAQIVHLIGYGLIERNGERFAIRYDTVKRFLQGKYKFERTGLTFAEQAEEIYTRMNDGELRLRALVRRNLYAHRKHLDPKQAFLSAMAAHKAVTEGQKRVAAGLEYKDLFDSTVNKGCYFKVLAFAIEQNYDTVFSAIFDQDQEATDHKPEYKGEYEEPYDKTTVITALKERFNEYRQIPAHPVPEDAKGWNNAKFEEFRNDMLWLEKILSDNE